MKKIACFLIFAALLSAAAFYLYQESLKKDVSISLSWNNRNSGRKYKQTLHLQVPNTKYDDFFAEIIGDESWTNAKSLFRKKAGLTKFMNGDVFSVTTGGGKIISYDLHHYKNNSKGELIYDRVRTDRYGWHPKD